MKPKTLYIIVCILIFLSFVVIMVSSFSNVAATSGTIDENLPEIIIDAGHGGEDGGAEANGVLEKDINLAVSRKVADFLRLNGFSVKEVRTEDISVYSDGMETLSQKKVSDLNNRLELFNSNPENVVVSIHQNKFDDQRYFGTQVFYSPNHENSALLAESIRKAVTGLLQNDNTRELKKADSNIFILNKAEVPAVIVECGFLSNPEEAHKLNSDDYQNRIAWAISLGIMEYHHTDLSSR